MTAKYLVPQSLQISKTLKQLKQIHSYLLKTLTKLPYDRYHCYTQFLTKLLQLPGDNLSYACQVFDQIPKSKSQYLWTSLIRNHVLRARFRPSLLLYAKMHRLGILPSGFTFSSVLNACARDPALLEAVIAGYTKRGMLDDARRLFDRMSERNVVTWSAMVAGYANCGNMKCAKEFYDGMTEKNSVTWVAMIAGYGKCGEVSEAKRLFDEILEPDVSCWAAMIACYAQIGYAKEAIEMYKAMKAGNVIISEVAMVGAISACTQLGDIEMAAILAKHVDEGWCVRTHYVSNALIHMHSKCGCLDPAWKEFDRMKDKDVVSYSSMIAAFADHGKSQEALDMFLEMRKEGINPNQVTFIGVLNACSHGGFVEDGCKHFELMTRAFGIKPLTEHLTCMVDLLGRNGQLKKAESLITDYKNVSDAGTWGALLGACNVHGNAELGEIAARHLFELEPENMGNYTLLANIYASIGKWKDSERVKIMMSEISKKKPPGCSWISS